MKASHWLVMLGMISGTLITAGVGVVAMCFAFWVWSHQMFIVGLQFPRGLIAISIPLLLVGSGAAVAVQALRVR